MTSQFENYQHAYPGDTAHCDECYCGSCTRTVNLYQTKHLTGWECPRCHIINSPYKLTCSCLPKLVNASTTGTINLTDMDEFGSYIIKINK